MALLQLCESTTTADYNFQHVRTSSEHVTASRKQLVGITIAPRYHVYAARRATPDEAENQPHSKTSCVAQNSGQKHARLLFRLTE